MVDGISIFVHGGRVYNEPGQQSIGSCASGLSRVAKTVEVSANTCGGVVHTSGKVTMTMDKMGLKGYWNKDPESSGECKTHCTEGRLFLLLAYLRMYHEGENLQNVMCHKEASQYRSLLKLYHAETKYLINRNHDRLNKYDGVTTY